MKKNYYEEEIQPLITEKRNDIAQGENSIKKITQSIFAKEIQTIAKYEEEKDKIWKAIVSGKQRKITANRHLEEYISIIAGLNNEETTQHGLQQSKQQPHQQRLSEQIGKYQTYINDHQNKKETIEHNIKSIVEQYVSELESYKNYLEKWMKDATEFYQISRSYKNEQQEEESHTIDQKIQILASLRYEKCHQIEIRQSSINKTNLMFLSTGSGHNKDITILYQSINNILKWNQTQETEKNRLIKELTQIQAKVSKIDWDRFFLDQGTTHYSTEGKEQGEEGEREQEMEEKIHKLEKHIKRYDNILKEITEKGNIEQTQKTRERIKQIEQEKNSINKEIKATRNTNEQKNIDKKESGDNQNHNNDQKTIELSKKENSIKQTIQKLETKKAMIQSFEKITKGFEGNIY